MKPIEIFKKYREAVRNMEHCAFSRHGYNGINSPRFGIAVADDKYALKWQKEDELRGKYETQLINILKKGN